MSLSHYGPAYFLWRAFQLVTRLRELAPRELPLDAVESRLRAWLARVGAQVVNHQDVALMMLCHAEAGRGPAPSSWTRRLLQSQRYYGSWGDVPLYLTALRGHAGWYSSRPVTTALCWHALRTALTR